MAWIRLLCCNCKVFLFLNLLLSSNTWFQDQWKFLAQSLPTREQKYCMNLTSCPATSKNEKLYTFLNKCTFYFQDCRLVPLFEDYANLGWCYRVAGVMFLLLLNPIDVLTLNWSNFELLVSILVLYKLFQ